MLIAIIILSIIAIVAFALPIILCDEEDEREESEAIKNLNEWQDKDNLEE